MRVALKLIGTYNGVMQAVEEAAADGAMSAARYMENRGKTRLREDTRRGFPNGARLANTWRGEIYPRGQKKSTHPAVLLYSNAPVLARAFDEPAILVNTRGGRFLAIPTPNAPPPAKAAKGKSRDWLHAARQKHPAMQFIPMAGGKYGVLAVKRLRNGKPTGELFVLFILVRRARLKKRMNWSRLFEEFERDWPQIYGTHVGEALRAAGF